MRYAVRVFDPVRGMTTDRTVRAASVEAACALARKDGQAVLAVRPAGGQRRARFDVGLFCQELLTLLASGMSIVEAVDVLGSRGDSERCTILEEIRGLLLEGKSLGAALESSEFDFPRLLVASVRASERSSRVADALREFVAYDGLTRELRAKLFSAALYPAIVITSGAGVCLFMLTYVVPRFAQVYDDVGHALSLPTRLLLAAARISHDHWALLAGSILACVAGGAYGYRSGALARIALRVASRFSVPRHYLRLFQLANLYQTVSMLVRGGYALADTLPLARHVLLTARLRTQLDAATAAVREGKRISTAFAANGLTDQVSERLLQAGERSGDLPRVMEIIAGGHRQDFMLAVERATRLIEPVLLMAMGVLIGTIIILMYAPIFELAGAM